MSKLVRVANREVADLKERVAASFSAHAADYDDLANVQRQVAERLAMRIAAALSTAPDSILEIGCGTGLLSMHLATLYPQAELVLTDISPAMLEQAKARLGSRASYRCMDGEALDPTIGKFCLIASSFTMQWFVNLRMAISRLADSLAPEGKLIFATLGKQSFAEWRTAYEILGIRSGLHSYPSADKFPWPAHRFGSLEVEIIQDRYPSGRAFLRSLKAIGAGQPSPGHKPLSPSQLYRVLDHFRGECTVNYEVLFGILTNS